MVEVVRSLYVGLSMAHILASPNLTLSLITQKLKRVRLERSIESHFHELILTCVCIKHVMAIRSLR